MRCEDPFVKQGNAFPCGRCFPCLKYRARVWSHRIILEATQHEHNSFVTLTYAEAPEELCPRDAQLWLKRLRKRVSPVKIRYYLCGELGDRNKRPHYHAAVFGLDPCRDSDVRETWRSGHVLVAPLTVKSAQYIAGYITKKLEYQKDIMLKGCLTHFSRMSRDPPLGADALWDVASEMMRYDLSPSPAGRVAKTIRPYGRTLRAKLHEYLSIEPATFVPSKEVLLVQQYAWHHSLSLKDVWSEVNSSSGHYKARGTL